MLLFVCVFYRKFIIVKNQRGKFKVINKVYNIFFAMSRKTKYSKIIFSLSLPSHIFYMSVNNYK